MDYDSFSNSLADLIASGKVPPAFSELCKEIQNERESGVSDVRVLRNCPIDLHIPDLDLDNPVADKYKKRHSLAKYFSRYLCDW